MRGVKGCYDAYYESFIVSFNLFFMKKCDVFSDCMCDRHLVMSLDLRVDLENRLAEVSRVVVPLKERIGGLSVSVNLAYQENGVSKYCNLPVYVTEDEQERVIKVSFPADLRVTIWTDGVEKAIHGLEYHVDKRTEVVTEVVTDVNQVPTAANRIHIYLETKNFVSNPAGMNSEANVLAVMEQVQDIRDWNMPVDFVLVLPNGMKYYLETTALYDKKSIVEISGRCPDSFLTFVKNDVIVLQVRRNGEDLSVSFQNQDEVRRDLLLLYENNDNVIDGQDRDVSDRSVIHAENWERFKQEIKRGYYPVVYLKSLNSGSYCPVSYQYTLSSEKSVLSLIMEISYYKEVNGVMELWLERRVFEDDLYRYAGDGKPEIKRVVLGTVVNG